MAYMDRAAALERIAVFETRLLPGSASMMDCAFFLGSSAGTPEEAYRVVETEVSAGRVRRVTAGRSRLPAPVGRGGKCLR
jgi:hypothetical protein